MQRATLSPRLATYLNHVAPVSVVKAPGAAELQARVDTYFAEAKQKYVVDGQTVQVAPEFRMVGGFNQDNTKKGLKALAAKMGNKPGQIPFSVVGHVMAGRGSPKEIGQVTQALIDLGKLPPADGFKSTEKRIRAMMWEHGVGIDCAGYVQQALASIHGKTHEQLGLKARLNEELGVLSLNPSFRQVNLLDAQPGDVITFKDHQPDQPGHAVLVARHQKTTAASVARYFDPVDTNAQEFLRSKDLEVFEVDSSWGGDTEGNNRGLLRKLWVYNRETGKWAAFDQHRARMVFGTTPYANHTVVGTFRLKETP